LGALFNDPHLWHEIQPLVGPDDFEDRRYRWLAEQFWDVLRNEGEPTFVEWLDAVEARGAGREEAATRAKTACIELAGRAEAMGEAKHLAAEAVGFFLKRRGGRELETLLAAARRGPDTESVGSKAGVAGDDGTALLRRLEEQLRATGRA
jgi:hypothetical protein